MYTKDRHKLYKVQCKLKITNCELKIYTRNKGKKKPDKNSIIKIAVIPNMRSFLSLSLLNDNVIVLDILFIPNFIC